MKLAVLVLGALLAGCAGIEIDRPPRVDVVVQKVPVPVPCISPEDQRKIKAATPETWALDAVAPEATVFVRGMAALAEVEQRRARDAVITAALKACE